MATQNHWYRGIRTRSRRIIQAEGSPSEVSSPKSMIITVPLSLQDSCKLKVISCIDSFPVYWLCKLPLNLKKKLLKVLPIFDRLHFENTAFCDGLEDLEETNPESTVDRHFRHFLGHFTGSRNDEMKQLFVASLFKAKSDFTSFGVIEGCRLELENLFVFLDCLSSSTDLVDFMSTAISSNFLSLKDYNNHGGVCVHGGLSLIPKHFTEFFAVDVQQNSTEITLKNLKSLIDYCNAQTTTVGNVFSVAFIDLVQSHIWDTYKIIRKETIDGSRGSHSSSVYFNPVCPQFIQDMLSSVEVVDFGTTDSHSQGYHSEEFSIEAPYFILHCLLSCNNPVLKSVNVLYDYDIPNTLDTFDTLAGFLCGMKYAEGDCGSQYLFTEKGNRFCLVYPREPYNGIENISFNFPMHGYRHFKKSSYADKLSKIAKSIIENKLASIKRLTISGFYFYCEIYHSMLRKSLVQFVQSPQFCSLTVDDAPDKKCRDLVIAFLCVPTSHEQELSISLQDDIESSNLEYFKNAKVPEDLPETNLQFKSLDLGKHHSQLAQHIVRFPYLNLKRLSISASNLFAAISKNNIASVQLYIKCKQGQPVPIEADKLDLFVCQNPSLTNLTFSFSNYSRGQKRPPSLFLVINSCLKKLLGKNHLLSEIELNGVRFSQFRGTDDHDLVPRHASVVVQPSSFSFSSNEQATSCINVPASVHDKDLYVFFMLVQRLGVTLILSGSEFESDGNLVLDVIPALETTLGAESTKINKIILKSMSTRLEATFEKIAKTVLIV